MKNKKAVVNFISVSPVNGNTNYVTTADFNVEFFDVNNKKIGSPMIHTIEYTKEQDVLDLVAYFEDKGKIYMAINESLRPALAARNIIIKKSFVDTNDINGKHFEAIAGYIRLEKGQTSLSDAAEFILKTKVGAKSAGRIEFLGGSYLPSVGGSTEMAFPRAIKVIKPKQFKKTFYGERFNAIRHTLFLPLQEIIDRYLRQEFHDTRMLELAFRLADCKGLKLNLNKIKLSNETSKKRIIGIDNDIATPASIRDAVSTTSKEKGKIVHVRVTPTSRSKQHFITTQILNVKNLDKNGKVIDNYNAEIAIRKGFDSVDVGCYFWYKNKLYIPVKRGVRSSLAIRNLRPHSINTDASPLHIEGVAGSLHGELTLEEIKKLAVRETEEEIGIAALSDPVFIGYDYPSPGHNPERTYRFLMEVDPTKKVSRKQTIDETVNVWYLEIDDLLSLADQGIIRDSRLTLNAHMIKSIFNYTCPGGKKIKSNREEINNFQELINSGSKLQGWISKQALEVDNKLNQSVLYRRLKLYCENELGVVVLELKHPKEAHYFSALIPVFAIPNPNDKRKMPFYLLHDLRHYTTGDYLPLIKDKNGKMQITSLDDYQRACGADECEAVWFSDVLIPKDFGLDEAEAIFGGTSVARVFVDMGMNDEEARKAIVSIELNGVIPKNVLKHPLYNKHKSVIVGRLLRYHVADYEQTRVVYGNWVNNLDVADTALRFCTAFNSRENYEVFFSKSLNLIKNYTEGMNPLRAELSRTINFNITLLALRIAHLKQYVNENKRKGYEKVLSECDKHINLLNESYKKLSDIRNKVIDVDMSEVNLKAFRLLNNELATTIKKTAAFSLLLAKDSKYLTKEQINHEKGRILPYFKAFINLDPKFVQARVDELERKSKELAGIKI